VAAVVVLSFPELAVVERATASAETSFPYIPGLLTFREGPALERAFERLTVRPDVVIFDGQGVAHPRGLGLAAHLGVLLDCPSVGCAKSRLFGETRGEPGVRRGSRRALTAPRDARAAGPFAPGERVGTVLRTRDGVKPVWVSVGHRADLPGAERLILRTTRGYRLSEPIRAAHGEVNSALRRLSADDDKP
jgi:deoxyribonuclease V